MKFEYRRVKLADLTTTGKGTYGIAAPGVEKNDNLYTYLRITDINDDGTLNQSDMKSVANDDAVQYLLKPNDIVFARTGGSTGRNYFYDGNDGTFVYAGFLIKFSIDPLKVNPKYIKYYCQSDAYKNWVKSFNTGSTRGNINAQTFGNMEISLPPREQQDYLVSILEPLDEKIAINRAINDNLQQQARSLYKSWFIDFDPFGNTMPADWKNGRLKDVLKLKRQSIKAGSNTVLPYLPIDIIPMRTFALTGFKPNEDAQSSLITFDKDDIIIGAMRVYFHRVVIAPCDGITRTTCFTLSPFQKDYLGFALLCCDQDSSIDYAQSTSKGSTMPYAIWEGGLGDMEIVIPSQKIARKFNELILPMIRQIQNSYFENSRLRELRDGLLPRLMSGELDVSAIEL